jgi:hypothetical protein
MMLLYVACAYPIPIADLVKISSLHPTNDYKTVSPTNRSRPCLTKSSLFWRA